MAKLPIFDPLQYLAEKRYAIDFAKVLELSKTPEGSQQLLEKKAKVEEFIDELRRETPQAIEIMVVQERKKEADLDAKKRQEVEDKMFYNSQSARADFAYWSKLAHWTLDEAVALSFGRAPEKVQWSKISPYVRISKFAFDYGRRRELTIRAKNWEQLFDPVLPGIFLAWAKRTALDYPAELEEAVTAHGHQVADWKTAFDNEKASHAETMKWAKAKIAETMEFAKSSQDQALEIGREGMAQRDEIIAALRQELAASKADSDIEPELSKPDLGARERESLLKLVIGLAIDGYGYDPKASKSPTAKEITGILELHGIGLDEDTVRKYLREAKELLPRNETE